MLFAIIALLLYYICNLTSVFSLITRLIWQIFNTENRHSILVCKKLCLFFATNVVVFLLNTCLIRKIFNPQNRHSFLHPDLFFVTNVLFLCSCTCLIWKIFNTENLLILTGTINSTDTPDNSTSALDSYIRWVGWDLMIVAQRGAGNWRRLPFTVNTLYMAVCRRQ